MSSTTSPSTTPVTTGLAPVTAPTGSSLVTIPGGTPGVSSRPPGSSGIPGSHNDGADFYGLAVALVVIVGVILLVRRVVPLRRAERFVGDKEAQPAEGEEEVKLAGGDKRSPGGEGDQ